MANHLCTYLCPMRLTSVDEDVLNAFNRYWQLLERMNCEVLVIDGSPEHISTVLKEKWRSCRLVRVDTSYGFLNGKVNGVLTGLKAASCEKIILADDDIRFTEADILRMVKELELHDLVKPQNYFCPTPVWSLVDSSRILINRVLFAEGDFPGCFGIRKTAFKSAGVFDGDVLFDNEELVKHFSNTGMRIAYARDFFIMRTPPTLRKWIEQRPRQAYEDFVMTWRSLFFFSMLPSQALLLALGKSRWALLLLLGSSAAAVALALLGRRGRAGNYIPFTSSLLAPVWVLERSVSIYVALYCRLAWGGYPFGDVIIRKGTGNSWKKWKENRRRKRFQALKIFNDKI